MIVIMMKELEPWSLRRALQGGQYHEGPGHWNGHHHGQLSSWCWNSYCCCWCFPHHWTIDEKFLYKILFMLFMVSASMNWIELMDDILYMCEVSCVLRLWFQYHWIEIEKSHTSIETSLDDLLQVPLRAADSRLQFQQGANNLKATSSWFSFSSPSGVACWLPNHLAHCGEDLPQLLSHQRHIEVSFCMAALSKTTNSFDKFSKTTWQQQIKRRFFIQREF